MIDPIGAFDTIRDNFIRYVKTAFGTRFPTLEVDREGLLRQDGILSREPWIEPLPRYESSGKGIDDLDSTHLPGLTVQQIGLFKSLTKCGLFDPERNLHSHQSQMLKDALTGKNCVVTAGTGSGKTESFLLPLFAYLVTQINDWSRPGPEQAHVNDWWQNEEWQTRCKKGDPKISYRVSQRGNETRPAAVRALILYPMNALVEDQMTRLRKALDSDSARQWFRDNAASNRIYLGRYNSATPVSGHEYKAPTSRQSRQPDFNKLDSLRKSLRSAELASHEAANYANDPANPDQDKHEAIAFFPRLDGSEMRSRWDMQDAPPDILITNYSMLSIMMMRDTDENIFEKTKAWIAGDDVDEARRELVRKSRIFHLIVDELHLYRGTAGTEVAYLLRLLLLRLGLHPDHPQLRILASSASLEAGNTESQVFLKDFFGASRFEIIEGKQQQLPNEAVNDYLPAEPFEYLSENVLLDEEYIVVNEPVFKEVVRQLNIPPNGETEFERLAWIIENKLSATMRLIRACEVDGRVRAVSIYDFASKLFGPGLATSRLKKAARGLLISRGLLDEAGFKTNLPSFRIHYFFKNIEGLWASTKPLAGAQDQRPVGKIYHTTRIMCDTPEARRVLEILYCENCGTVFFGGSRLSLENGVFELLATTADIDGIPERQAARLVERRSYGDFAIFWPLGSQSFADPARWKQRSIVNDNSPWAQWLPASLNTSTGHVQLSHEVAAEQPDLWVRGYIFQIAVGSDDNNESYSALPCVCPSCEANHTKRRRRSPVRGFRTGFSKVSQIFTKELFYQLPERIHRKLVTFSDSREDAAQIANGVERNHYFDLVRETVVDELHVQVLGEPALLDDIELNRPYGKFAKAYVNRNSVAEAEIKKLLEYSRTIIPPGLPATMEADLKTLIEAAKQRLQNIRSKAQTRIVPLDAILPPAANLDDCGLLLRRLLKIGINPAGNDVLLQDFGWERRFHHWTVLFDFETLNWKQGLPQGAHFARERFRSELTSALADMLFSRLYFGFESAGLGWAKLALNDDRLTYYAVRAGISL